MKTMGPPNNHHNGFVATHSEHIMHGYELHERMRCHKVHQEQVHELPQSRSAGVISGIYTWFYMYMLCMIHGE